MKRIFLAALALLLAACASTTVRSEWRDPADAAGAVERLAVFVAARDGTTRAFVEGQLALRLAGRNRVLAASGGALGLGADVSEARLREALARDGFDAALLVRLVSTDTVRQYHPPETRFVGGGWGGWGPGYRSFYSYYPFVYTTPGYTTTTTRVVVELLLYRLPEGRMVWNAVTETVNPDSSAELVEGVERALADGLRRHKLLAPRPGA
ncbi:hypothetical protein [Crenobacter luteus]|uniref:DUF4136 domain-containing protein n=1 Tax=Crenobacter luteus TaxID=1452487 RepID=A0A161TM75_9NEIS|nr:hypothetical protein [Crenobacter luteus]KZE27248.1 hypothetical protein AVW16_01495 [Crenobacter luteus]